MGKSSNGLLIAATAASCALIFPLPVPTPIKAVPAFFITARTSAKSTLTKPGLIIISEIPTTPCRKMSSATKNASVTGVLSGTICSNLSFDTTIIVSTAICKFFMASSACFIRFLPSKLKGFVTTPTVRHPHSFLAISATTGAAPLPVPPPIPLVTKIKSAPLHISLISSAFSIAALFPTSGFPPAPRPRVVWRPILSVFGARLLVRACASVLMAQKDTPSMRVSIMRLTAFPPAPPTPKTFMIQGLPKPPSGTIPCKVSNIGGRLLFFFRNDDGVFLR
mmetsp:Transcript_15772/g.22528  ORF Transcript_15772/g.22528 Transcript_15772/m.22528 type:complete len:279 (-) Transcript_15772:297-1133(-)